MNRKIRSLYIFVILMLFKGAAYAYLPTCLPAETAFFQMPEGSPNNWKEVSRLAKEKEVIIEFIPSNHTAKNWSDGLMIVYRDRFLVNRQGDLTIDAINDYFQKDAGRNYS